MRWDDDDDDFWFMMWGLEHDERKRLERQQQRQRKKGHAPVNPVSDSGSGGGCGALAFLLVAAVASAASLVGGVVRLLTNTWLCTPVMMLVVLVLLRVNPLRHARWAESASGGERARLVGLACAAGCLYALIALAVAHVVVRGGTPLGVDPGAYSIVVLGGGLGVAAWDHMERERCEGPGRQAR